MGLRHREFLSRKLSQEFFQLFFLVALHSHWRCHRVRVAVFTLPSPFLGLRNPPRPLLVAGPSSTGSSDSDGGLFAVPTTLPPNSRHGKLFSPNKETELTFLQHLNSISVSEGTAHSRHPHLPCDLCLWSRHAQGTVFLTDAVGFLLAKAPEVAEPAPAEAAGGPGQAPRSGLRGPASHSHSPSCPDTLVLSRVLGVHVKWGTPAPSFLL